MHDSPSEKVLRREVQPPHRQPTGLGVMLIASAAMFFAVAGSAFVVRARMAGHCCDRAHRAPIVEVQPIVPAAPRPAQAPCGEAVYRAGEDGKLLVDFYECPPPVTVEGARVVEPPARILIADH